MGHSPGEVPARSSGSTAACTALPEAAVVEAPAETKPVREAALNDAEARENARYYLQKRQQIEDECFEVEQEWIHMFSHVGDLGAAMELGAQKEELERQLEEMSEREGEIAEQMVEIRDVRKEVRAGEKRLKRLQGELEEQGASADELRAELQQLQETWAEQQALTARVRAEQRQRRADIKTAIEELAKAKEESERLEKDIQELNEGLAEAKALAAPQCEERDRLVARVAELRGEMESMQAAAQTNASELTAARAEVERLEQAKAESAELNEALKADLRAQEAALRDLPAEVRATTERVDALKAKIAEMEKALGPEGEKLSELRAEVKERKDTVNTLEAERSFVALETDACIKARERLTSEKEAIEAETASLRERRQTAQAERDHFAALRPDLVAERDRMLEEVATAVDETRVMRKELLSQAKDAQDRLKDLDLDEALAEEEKVLQGTAAEIGVTAKAVSDRMRKAQAAFESAVTLRKRAQEDFSRFTGAMEKRMAALQAQEAALASSVSDQQELEQEVQALIFTTAAHAERFRSAKRSVSNFSGELSRISNEYQEGSNTERLVSSVVKGALGIFGSLVKAGAEQLDDDVPRLPAPKGPGDAGASG